MIKNKNKVNLIGHRKKKVKQILWTEQASLKLILLNVN